MPELPPDLVNRRTGTDRRKRPFYALLVGSFARRRRDPRRDREAHLAAVDWHDARWLAVALGILVFCCADAVLTLTLLSHGAYEANPLMRPLVLGSGGSFVAWKLTLTGAGVLALVVVARLRAFGGLPVGFFLYVILGLYGLLVGYELWLLDRLTGAG
jgi:hypothetical protein